MRKIHVIAGLPRTGSTLLCNILSQNPRVHTTATSALAETLAEVKERWNGKKGHQVDKKQGDKENLRRVMKAMMQAYHNTDRDLIFDKNRGWMGHAEMLEWVIEDKAKMIITVRDINSILASFEKIHRNEVSHRMHKGPRPSTNTIMGRCEWLLDKEKGMVGIPYTQLQDMFIKKLRDRMLLVEYDALCNDPVSELKKIYEFIGEEYYEHDFKNIPQYTKEDDNLHGYDNLHVIRPELMKIADDPIKVIGNDAVRKFRNFEFWRKL